MACALLLVLLFGLAILVPAFAHLRPVLVDGVLSAADAAIQRAGEVTVSATESHLLGVLEHLSAGLVHTPVLASVVSQEPSGPRIVRED